MMPYNPNCYYDYGYDWFKLSGGGHQVAWGVHHFDIVHWAMGVRWPKAIAPAAASSPSPRTTASGPTPFRQSSSTAPGRWPSRGSSFNTRCGSAAAMSNRAHAKCFYGTEATLLIDRGRYTIVGETPRDGKKAVPDVEVLASQDEYRHQKVFLDNVRNRTKPFADVEVGHYSSNVGHLMNMTYEVGRNIRWDGQREQVIGDAEANAQACIGNIARPGGWRYRAFLSKIK